MFSNSRWLTTIALLFFQVLGLLIPLLTLPLLSTALGVSGFGQVMMAQAIVLLAVVWVDSGFNVQSQQEASCNLDLEMSRPQALLDNLIARSYAALKALCILMLTPLCIPELTYSLLIASVPLILGTLMFPQWWLIATGRGFVMGFVMVIGRLISAFLVWYFVRTEQDIISAAFAISVGTLLSGLMVISVWLIPIYRNHQHLSWTMWRNYVDRIKPTLLPAFFANACAQLPIVALGTFAGALQTGLFTAADRLTRAGGHLLGLVEQSFITQWMQPIANQPSLLNKMRQRILIIIPIVLGCSLLVAWYLAPWVIHFLYNDSFEAAAVIFRWLLVWLWLQTIRRFLVAIFWLVDRDIQLQALINWMEVFFYVVLVLAIAVCTRLLTDTAWASITAYGLCGIELLLLVLFFSLHTRKQRLSKTSQIRRGA